MADNSNSVSVTKADELDAKPAATTADPEIVKKLRDYNGFYGTLPFTWAANSLAGKPDGTFCLRLTSKMEHYKTEPLTLMFNALGKVCPYRIARDEEGYTCAMMGVSDPSIITLLEKCSSRLKSPILEDNITPFGESKVSEVALRSYYTQADPVELKHEAEDVEEDIERDIDTSTPKSIYIIPRLGASAKDDWYVWLCANPFWMPYAGGIKFIILSLPATESQTLDNWMKYLKSKVSVTSESYFVAHGESSQILLRFLAQQKEKIGGILLIGAYVTSDKLPELSKPISASEERNLQKILPASLDSRRVLISDNDPKAKDWRATKEAFEKLLGADTVWVEPGCDLFQKKEEDAVLDELKLLLSKPLEAEEEEEESSASSLEDSDEEKPKESDAGVSRASGPVDVGSDESEESDESG